MFFRFIFLFILLFDSALFAVVSRQVPDWFQEEPAIYAVGNCGYGAGSTYLPFDGNEDFKHPIDSFEKLPNVLREARQFGANILYLYDWWEGVENNTNYDAYLNKGDYIPRQSLGGKKALQYGIMNLHKQGGRVILYLEPLIVFEYAELAKQAKSWAIINKDKQPLRLYPLTFSMCPACPSWRKYIIAKAVEIIEEYDADGIYLDSYPNRWDLKCFSREHRHAPGDPEAFNKGFISLIEEIRLTVRRVKPDAVVMLESYHPKTVRHADGSLDWKYRTIGDKPLKAVYPNRKVFLSGQTLRDLYRNTSAGYGLALSPWWKQYENEICNAMKKKFAHKDFFNESFPVQMDVPEHVYATMWTKQDKSLFCVVNNRLSPVSMMIQNKQTGEINRDLWMQIPAENIEFVEAAISGGQYKLLPSLVYHHDDWKSKWHFDNRFKTEWLKEDNGREGILLTHPISEQEPFRIVGEFDTSMMQEPQLLIGIRGYYDSVIKILINGEIIDHFVIQKWWTDLSIPLESQNKKLNIEIHHMAGGLEQWNHEHAYFDYLTVGEKEGK